ncbi:helix-turn-helix domain-containing protein [Altererythrobacter endophyticus]|uniref:Helix-turn-helix domain-containing protein n=1 Tax=Altericroceibacterium endophyticum TaxID=1808508 RepID=A0A6I4T5T4_9SPHN|nr:helix-turn-helix domain-containing protein [Altericroceibacterium endophyticum]
MDAPEDTFISCGMCNDITYIRMLMKGKWTAETADGTGHYEKQALLFGPHSHRMPITCTGPIATVGIGLRPGALHAITRLRSDQIVDRILPVEEFGLAQQDFTGALEPGSTPEDWLEIAENALIRLIDAKGARRPDPLCTAFDQACFANPNLSVSDFSDRHDVGIRRLERLVKRDFGLTPKQVLRRARALDLASQLCGVADSKEEAETLLRYCDQSHQIREFATFFGATPHQFAIHAKPLLTLNLETRQSRRLEELARIEPDDRPPWRDD